jgi:plastocyanin
MSLRSVVFPALAAIVVAVLALAVRHQPVTTTARATQPVSSQGRHVTVPIRSYDFVPKSLTVKVGTRVTWTNHDATAHTATANDGAFDTGTVAPKGSHTIDFTHPGTFSYHCAFHAFMTAMVTVRQ